jgi:putative FmdB family regulatory protein
MPIYEYKCQQCGQKFEVRQRISEEPLKVHEECGGEVERLISASALHFKGTGWYVTDYAKNGKSPSASTADSKSDTKSESEGKSKPAAESKTETKAETKSEASPATK